MKLTLGLHLLNVALYGIVVFQPKKIEQASFQVGPGFTGF
jgi:hypothetical protein